MKTTLLSTTLTLLTTAFITTTTTAAPVPAPAIPGVASFTLKAGPGAPSGLAGRIVTWDGTSGGNLGFFSNSGAKDLSSFIQYNATEGIAFYARNTALQVYLRPTHGTPQYLAKLGNPQMDDEAALTLSTNFTVSAWAVEPGEVHYAFGYDWKDSIWSACGGPDEYTLYYGEVGTPGAGCTANFGLELFYD